MADTFYSLQEACSKLGKTEEEVKALVASGQLEEIRDGEDLKFAAADIDVLAGNNDRLVISMMPSGVLDWTTLQANLALVWDWPTQALGLV